MPARVLGGLRRGSLRPRRCRGRRLVESAGNAPALACLQGKCIACLPRPQVEIRNPKSETRRPRPSWNKCHRSISDFGIRDSEFGFEIGRPPRCCPERIEFWRLDCASWRAACCSANSQSAIADSQSRSIRGRGRSPSVIGHRLLAIAPNSLVRLPGVAPGRAPWRDAILLLNHNRALIRGSRCEEALNGSDRKWAGGKVRK